MNEKSITFDKPKKEEAIGILEYLLDAKIGNIFSPTLIIHNSETKTAADLFLGKLCSELVLRREKCIWINSEIALATRYKLTERYRPEYLEPFKKASKEGLFCAITLTTIKDYFPVNGSEIVVSMTHRVEHIMQAVLTALEKVKNENKNENHPFLTYWSLSMSALDLGEKDTVNMIKHILRLFEKHSIRVLATLNSSIHSAEFVETCKHLFYNCIKVEERMTDDEFFWLMTPIKIFDPILPTRTAKFSPSRKKLIDKVKLENLLTKAS